MIGMRTPRRDGAPHGAVWRLCALAALFAASLAASLAAFQAGPAAAQEDGPDAASGVVATSEPEPKDEAAEAEAATRARATAQALQTINNILSSVSEKRAQSADLRAAIEAAETDVDKTAASEALKTLNAEIEELDRQVEALATGASASDFRAAAVEKFDLQGELEQLIQPFILMLKSATENARAIETLKRTVLLSERNAAAAEGALANLEPLLAAAPSDGPVADRLKEAYTAWRERRDAARDRAAAATRQLEARLAARTDPAESAGEAFQNFFSERGRNLAFGLGVFAAVFFVMRLLSRGALALIGAPRNRSVPARLGAFTFDILTVFAAFGAMLAIFNRYNDWLLTGLTVLLLLAIGWFVLRSAPALFEQITLLLNLGAVQEGERVMLDGTPWLVAKLDFYTDLENPALRGGTFTLPIRELRGLHSRPMDDAEDWFPSAEGDVVRLSSGLWGEVVLQSPEFVQIRSDGGAVTTLTVAAYLAESPTNLSKGFEATATLRIDYAHRAEAPDAIPRILATYARERLADEFKNGAIRGVSSELVAAGDAGLEIELAAEVSGSAAPRVEDIEHALNRLAVSCAVKHGWEIPRHPLARSDR